MSLCLNHSLCPLVSLWAVSVLNLSLGMCLAVSTCLSAGYVSCLLLSLPACRFLPGACMGRPLFQSLYVSFSLLGRLPLCLSTTSLYTTGLSVLFSLCFCLPASLYFRLFLFLSLLSASFTSLYFILQCLTPESVLSVCLVSLFRCESTPSIFLSTSPSPQDSVSLHVGPDEGVGSLPDSASPPRARWRETELKLNFFPEKKNLLAR